MTELQATEMLRLLMLIAGWCEVTAYATAWLAGLFTLKHFLAASRLWKFFG